MRRNILCLIACLTFISCAGQAVKHEPIAPPALSTPAVSAHTEEIRQQERKFNIEDKAFYPTTKN